MYQYTNEEDNMFITSKKQKLRCTEKDLAVDAFLVLVLMYKAFYQRAYEHGYATPTRSSPSSTL